MRFKTFESFSSLFEKQIPLSNDLEEYTVEDKGKGKFTVEIEGIEKEFSVMPVPSDIDEYEKLFFSLVQSLDADDPSLMYTAIKKIENMPYHFGNLSSTSLSLNNVKELSINLTPEQREALSISETEFLKDNFKQLDKSIKNSITKYLKKTAQIYAVVLESLFYYMRNGDSKKFYDGMDFNSILKTYQEALDLSAKKYDIELQGPYSDIKNKNTIDNPVEYAYWSASKDDRNWIIRATTSPGDLNSEENVIGKKGLNLTFLDDKNKEISDLYTSFPYYELEKKLSSFI
jgi:hypothetical protein